MLTKTKIIGFLGIDKYEIILYLSRILKNLNKKVLLIDKSENQKLAYCIPCPLKLEKKKLINYSGVDFIGLEKTDTLNEINKEEYDFILIDFGLENEEKDLVECSELYLVTNLDKYNAQKLNSLNPSIWESVRKVTLLIKDILECKIKPQYVRDAELVNVPADKNNSIFLYQDYQDEKTKLQWQYDSVVNFKHISKPLKNLLIDSVNSFCDSCTQKEIMRAYRAAAKGE